MQLLQVAQGGPGPSHRDTIRSRFARMQAHGFK
jgi:hypothetical protein